MNIGQHGQDAFLGRDQDKETYIAKLPLITALFWVMKILATTLGETGGDVIGQTLNLGYLTGVGIFVGFLAIVLFSPDGVLGLWDRWRAGVAARKAATMGGAA